jgi:hypothetical protein
MRGANVRLMLCMNAMHGRRLRQPFIYSSKIVVAGVSLYRR